MKQGAAENIDDNIILLVKRIREKFDRNRASILLDAIQPTLNQCREQLIEKYLSAARVVRNERKTLSVKKLRERRELHLKQLLTPFADLRLLDSTTLFLDYPFIDEKIWIAKEIDVSRLRYDKKRYRIESTRRERITQRDGKRVISGFDEVIDPACDQILMVEEFKNGMEELRRQRAEGKAGGRHEMPITLSGNKGQYTFKEVWDKWIESLTQEVMKSTDLLDQILVTYTIKRALNGDKRAVDRLTSVYAEATIGNALKVAKKGGLNIMKAQQRDSIKERAIWLLKFIISGFRPEGLIGELKGDKQKQQYTRVPKWVREFYICWLSEYVPERLEAIMRDQPSNPLLALQIAPLLDICSPIAADTSFRPDGKIMTRRFNNDSFRPTRKGNFTTFLFGTQAKPIKGKFFQLLPNVLGLDKRERHEIPCDNMDDHEGPSRLEDEIKDRSDWGAVRAVLRDLGFSDRDIDIFVRMASREETKTEIALDHGLSRRHIYRIHDNIRTALASNPEILSEIVSEK